MITAQQIETLRKVTEKFHPTLLGVFGSYSRGENVRGSDLDILVDFQKKVSLLDLIGMEQKLSELFGFKVDLITQGSLNKNLKPYIEKDLIRII
jgi:uncharacterized protein